MLYPVELRAVDHKSTRIPWLGKPRRNRLAKGPPRSLSPIPGRTANNVNSRWARITRSLRRRIAKRVRVLSCLLLISVGQTPARCHFSFSAVRGGRSFFALSLSFARGGGAAETPVDFAGDVAPILAAHCLRCHGPNKQEGDFSVATKDGLEAFGLVEPGAPEDSYLLELVRPPAEGERPVMPAEGDSLTDEQVAVLRAWIQQGGQWPQGFVVAQKALADTSSWSLQPLSQAIPPGVESLSELPHSWRESPIDRFVFEGLKKKGLSPSPPADRRVLIRRATYDLTGLPPSPAEVADFVADNSLMRTKGWLIVCSASPHYGEQWGRHWLDVVRFGESTGFEQNVIIDNAWPFRDYVIRSLNQDKPFDRFVIEHLAGDVIAPGDRETEVGVTFLVCGPYDGVGNQDPVQAAQIRANTIDDMIRASAEAFLGLTVGCGSLSRPQIRSDTAKGLLQFVRHLRRRSPWAASRCDGRGKKGSRQAT